ncbi:MAG: GNAT family N-acetyltransferase [Tepidiformaceae bacterium]
MKVPLLALLVQGERFRLESGDSGKLAVIRLQDQVVVGACTIEFRQGTLTVRSLCIEPPYRSYGAGTEAAGLLITVAEAAGVSLIRAWAHPNLGLSAYFWGRMGLRPRHGEGPEGGIWYERVTGAGSSAPPALV